MAAVVPGPSDIARFNVRVRLDEATGCHLWTGSLVKGYGRFKVQKKSIYAHRFAYLVQHGYLPALPLHLDHLCRVPACVNPAHLEPVTCRENQMRSPISVFAQHAKQSHCVNGHPFDDVNTYIRRDNGARMCRACNRERRRKPTGYSRPVPSHCRRGHEFTEANTDRRGGRRRCRVCQRASEQRRQGAR